MTKAVVQAQQVRKSKVFIGSSVESLSYAEKLQICLKDWTSPSLWKYDVFKLSKTTVENLETEFPKYDLAIFILTPDDKLNSRGKDFTAPRDNLIFETGLSYGIIRERGLYLLFLKILHLKFQVT